MGAKLGGLHQGVDLPMRRQPSLRYFCGLPPFRRHCCIRIPDEIVKDPDPGTFDAELTFAFGAGSIFNNPHHNTTNLRPMAPIYAIFGPDPAEIFANASVR